MTSKWYARPQVLLAALVFVITLGVYAATLAPTTPFWDCGEFITASHIVGVPHQPGTPLYVLFGRVFDVLLGDPDITQPAYRTAWAVNFMSAFFSALAVMLVYLIIWELARRADPDSGWLAHAGGLVGAFFLAFSETFWNNATEAEVYGLSAFMFALLAWLAIKWYDSRESRGSHQLLLLMVYLLGLGVGFHLGSLFVYPGIFLLILMSRDRRLANYDLFLMTAGGVLFMLSTAVRNNAVLVVLLIAYGVIVAMRSIQGRRFALLGSLLFVGGLTVHLMLLIRAGASPEPFINQSDPDNFKTLLSVIRREQYPPLNPFDRQAPITFQFQYYYDFLFKQFYFLGTGSGLLSTATTVLGPIFLALLGAFHGLRRIRPLVFVPLVNYFINGEGLTLLLNFTDHEVRDRDYFYFAAFLFFAVFIGLGAAALLRFVAGSEGKSAFDIEKVGAAWKSGVERIRIGAIPTVLAIVLVGISLWPVLGSALQHEMHATKFHEHDRSENRIAYEYAWNILAGLDENAIVFTNGDNDTFPIWYLQAVEHFRTDVTVVNLSLVNLQWYIKQLKHNGKPVAMQRTDAEIDALQHRLYQDPQTGEQQVLMIKDYVLHDIILTNHQMEKRPVFFAVTIPQEIMARYFPMLQMEGMAYRLMDEASEDKMPITDPDKVLENMLGVYRMDALMDGDTSQRQSLYAQVTGLANDGINPILGGPSERLSVADYDTLRRAMGGMRNDIYRNKNAVHLLGNYPAAYNRAGYEFYLRANAAARQDSVYYREQLDNALTAFEASLAVAPFNEQAIEFYPLLLVQGYRDQDAKDFLSSLIGKIPEEMEERVIFNAMRGITRGGVPDLALDWIAEQIEINPDRHYFYQVKFSLHQALGDAAGARATAEAWERHSGAPDEEMVNALTAMQREALGREDDRIREALEGNDEE